MGIPVAALTRAATPGPTTFGGRGPSERAIAEALTILSTWTRSAPDLTIEEMRARVRRTLAPVDRDIAIKLETVIHSLLELEQARTDLLELDEARERLRELLRERLNALAVQTRINRSAGKLSCERVEVATQWKPCSGMSGDWWASYTLSDGRVVIVLGDSVGHGSSAALLSGIARGACDLVMRRVDPQQIKPSVVVAELNAALRDTGATGADMTCVVAILDPETGELVVATAGHPPAFIVPRSKSQGNMRSLGTVGPGLGTEDNPQYVNEQITMVPGDMFLVFSDGLLDCGDGKRSFGVRRLRQALESLRDTHPNLVRDQLWLRLKAMRNAAPLTDDVTYVLLRYLG